MKQLEGSVNAYISLKLAVMPHCITMIEVIIIVGRWVTMLPLQTVNMIKLYTWKLLEYKVSWTRNHNIDTIDGISSKPIVIDYYSLSLNLTSRAHRRLWIEVINILNNFKYQVSLWDVTMISSVSSNLKQKLGACHLEISNAYYPSMDVRGSRWW